MKRARSAVIIHVRLHWCSSNAEPQLTQNETYPDHAPLYSTSPPLNEMDPIRVAIAHNELGDLWEDCGAGGAARLTFSALRNIVFINLEIPASGRSAN